MIWWCCLIVQPVLTLLFTNGLKNHWQNYLYLHNKSYPVCLNRHKRLFGGRPSCQSDHIWTYQENVNISACIYCQRFRLCSVNQKQQCIGKLPISTCMFVVVPLHETKVVHAIVVNNTKVSSVALFFFLLPITWYLYACIHVDEKCSYAFCSP